MINEILLRRKNKLDITACDYVTNNSEKAMILSIAKNIESLGYTFSKEVYEVLFTFSKENIENFYKDLMPKLKRLTGADKTYNSMYPNFPQQVMEATDIELYVNAIMHYFTFGEWMPQYAKDERLPLLDDNKMMVLSIGDKADIMDIMSNLLQSKTSISQQDKDDITSIITDYADYYNYLPSEIPLKENVALLCKIIINNAPLKNAEHIQHYFKTATDVLRLITALSDGDISLSQKTVYKHLKRPERRMIMDLLANCNNIIEDMFRYQYEWIRVGEIIHPFTYKSAKYFEVNKAFKLLRNDDKPLMFGGKLHSFLEKKDMLSAANLLKQRPGEFARSLDKILRDSLDKNYIINCFKEIAENVATPVLLQVRQHFMGRNDNEIRVFFPKGNLAKSIVSTDKLPAIEERYCKAVVKICDNAIIENYKKKEFMGNVYIDQDFKNYIVPFSQRSASKANKSIVRGSKIEINKNTNVTRAFVWWTNLDDNKTWSDRVDIDLSAAIYDENWNFVEHISYTRLRSDELKAYHSGDITDGGDVGGNGVAEFLDVDVNAVNKKGRYIVYQVYSFTGQKFSDMPNCRFGWMKRQEVNSGEIFEPSTVEMNIDITSESKIAIPVIFDCKEKRFIWCDMNLGIRETRSYYGGNNLESNLSGVQATCYAMTHLNKANLYDLIALNTKARGLLVENRDEADIIFSNDVTIPTETINEVVDGEVITKTREKENVKIITAFDIDYFVGQML